MPACNEFILQMFSSALISVSTLCFNFFTASHCKVSVDDKIVDRACFWTFWTQRLKSRMSIFARTETERDLRKNHVAHSFSISGTERKLFWWTVFWISHYRSLCREETKSPHVWCRLASDTKPGHMTQNTQVNNLFSQIVVRSTVSKWAAEQPNRLPTYRYCIWQQPALYHQGWEMEGSSVTSTTCVQPL